MTDRPMAGFDDETLEDALRSLASTIEWPTAAPANGPDIATRVRVGLASERRPAARSTKWWRPASRPVRRSVLLALAALLALAVVAGAVGLGLPGLRIILGEPPGPSPTVAPSASPSAGSPSAGSPTAPAVPGARLGLGTLVAIDRVEARTGRPVRLPSDPALGPPDAAFVDTGKANQVAYVWAERADLPASLEPGVGLVLMQFDGVSDDEYFQKVIGSGTAVEPVRVAGQRGFWISGEMHFFFYVRSDGRVIQDDRRWIGDALVWTDGRSTSRIESSIGRDATIAFAESIE